MDKLDICNAKFGQRQKNRLLAGQPCSASIFGKGRTFLISKVSRLNMENTKPHIQRVLRAGSQGVYLTIHFHLILRLGMSETTWLLIHVFVECVIRTSTLPLQLNKDK